MKSSINKIEITWEKISLKDNCPWSPNASCHIELFSDINRAFIITSNAPDRDPYREAIKEVFREFKLEPNFAYDLNEYNGKVAFCTHICGQIRKARVIIADLSGTTIKFCTECGHEEEYSVNVFWEYGYAAALEKDPILIYDENQLLPFEVVDKNAEEYNLGNIKEILRPLLLQVIRLEIW